jgi:predicted DNA-binding protein (UPF0251 family)
MDLSTRPLTLPELELLRARLRSLGLSNAAAARALGVSEETLRAALWGQRVQPAKREKMLNDR